MRSAISQLLVTGDVLIQMTDEYQIRIHRRDNYVVRRSTSGDVMYMITREQVDSLSLSPEQIEMIGLDLETEMNTRPTTGCKISTPSASGTRCPSAGWWSSRSKM